MSEVQQTVEISEPPDNGVTFVVGTTNQGRWSGEQNLYQVLGPGSGTRSFQKQKRDQEKISIKCCILSTSNDLPRWASLYSRPVRMFVHAAASRVTAKQYILVAMTTERLIDWRILNCARRKNARMPGGHKRRACLEMFARLKRYLYTTSKKSIGSRQTRQFKTY